MKCSSTTVKRSLRWKPATTLRDSGATGHRVAVVRWGLDARAKARAGLAQQVVADGAFMLTVRGVRPGRQVGALQVRA